MAFQRWVEAMARTTAPSHLSPSLRDRFEREGEDVFYSKRPWLAPTDWQARPPKPFVGVDGLLPTKLKYWDDPVTYDLTDQPKPYAGQFTKLVAVVNVVWHWANDELDTFEAPMLALRWRAPEIKLENIRLRRFVAKWDITNRWLTVVHSYVFAYWFTDDHGAHHFYQE